MASSIFFCCGKKEFCVGTEGVDSVPVSSFIRSIDGSNKFYKFEKVNVKSLTVNPSLRKYLSAKHHWRSLSEIVSVLVESDLYM